MFLNKINYKFFKYYIYICLILSIFFLYHKFNYPTDWSTSEWLINYQGGFTRRGLIGEFLIQINQFLDLKIRNLVFFFEIILLTTYYLYVIYFFKKVKFSPLIILIVFSPLSFLFPVTETEAIARKEILLFCLYIFYLSSLFKNNKNVTYLILIIGLPLINLTWDGNVFYFLFFVYTYFVSKKDIKKNDIIYFFLALMPYFVTSIILFMTKSNNEMLQLMCQAIQEPCFGAMNFLDYSFKDQMNYGLSRLKFEYLIRYSFVFIICFIPLLGIFLYEGNRNKIFLGYIACIFPTFIFLSLSFDWGRYLYILYTFSIFTLVFLIKIKKIDLEKSKIFYLIDNLLKGKFKMYIFLYFFLYLFCWYPKSILTDDLGSLPYIRIIDRIYDYIMIV